MLLSEEGWGDTLLGHWNESEDRVPAVGDLETKHSVMNAVQHRKQCDMENRKSLFPVRH